MSFLVKPSSWSKPLVRVLPRGCPDQTANGSRRRTPASSKPAWLRVTTIRSWDCAPRGAKTCEQFCPPQARFSFPCQAMKPLNSRGDGRSRLVRLFPLRNSKMPNLNSPRIMGSTAYSRSLRRSHSTTLETGAGLVGSLNTLASTRYLTARRSTRIRRERRNLSRGTRATSPPRPHSAAPNAA